MPSGASGDSSASSTDQATLPTSESGSSSGESIDDLDQALDRSLEGFDDSMGSNSPSPGNIDILSPSGNSEIQTDSTEISLETSSSAGDMAVAEENDSLAERASSGMDGETQDPSTSSSAQTNSNQTSGNQSAQQQGNTEQSIPIPEDIGDGQGDNIVLRQIREAAMKERDPVLRDRLWDEYRKIKNQ